MNVKVKAFLTGFCFKVIIYANAFDLFDNVLSHLVALLVNVTKQQLVHYSWHEQK